MKSRIFAIAALASFVPLAGALAEEPHVAPIMALVESLVRPALSDPAIVSAIVAQNARTAALTEAEILELDKQWRAEVDAAERPLVSEVMGNALSDVLTRMRDEAGGVFTEIFVMDARGLNVGQSDLTSDYWQGDEAKWQKTFLVGPDAVFVDEIEVDESTQALQSQVSLSIADESGAPVGAITLGVDVDAL
ncbi:MAG: hypothetical protein ACFE0R_11415 [Salinarimonas sp.]